MNRSSYQDAHIVSCPSAFNSQEATAAMKTTKQLLSCGLDSAADTHANRHWAARLRGLHLQARLSCMRWVYTGVICTGQNHAGMSPQKTQDMGSDSSAHTETVPTQQPMNLTGNSPILPKSSKLFIQAGPECVATFPTLQRCASLGTYWKRS